MTEALYLVKIIDFPGIYNSGGACYGRVVVGAAFSVYHPASYRTMCASKEASVSCLEMVRRAALTGQKHKSGNCFRIKQTLWDILQITFLFSKTHWEHCKD